MEILITNKVEEIGIAAEKTEEFLSANELPGDIINSVNLAAEELLTNTIFYGYADEGEHQISINLILKDRELSIVFKDDADEFNPLNTEEPDVSVPLEERKIGGLGIFLVKKLMDSFEYKREGNCNVITIRKKIKEI